MYLNILHATFALVELHFAIVTILIRSFESSRSMTDGIMERVKNKIRFSYYSKKRIPVMKIACLLTDVDHMIC